MNTVGKDSHGSIYSFAVSNGKLVAGYETGIVRVWDMATWTCEVSEALHPNDLF